MRCPIRSRPSVQIWHLSSMTISRHGWVIQKVSWLKKHVKMYTERERGVRLNVNPCRNRYICKPESSLQNMFFYVLKSTLFRSFCPRSFFGCKKSRDTTNTTKFRLGTVHQLLKPPKKEVMPEVTSKC